MADSTAQDSLLRTIPKELLDQINSSPRDIYEKIHQRELLLIEQIRHFASIRTDELANYSRNLLNQRQIEQEQSHRRSSQPHTPITLKSIVKREPSLMEKRVSFSELPPEVEEFYSTNDDLYDSEDSDKRYDFNTIETSSDDEELRYSYVTGSGPTKNGSSLPTSNSSNHSESPVESKVDLQEPQGQEQEPLAIEDGPAIPELPEAASPSRGVAQHGDTTLQTSSPSLSADFHNILESESSRSVPAEGEPVISFEDAYGQDEFEPTNELPDFDQEPSQEDIVPLTKPTGFVGSAPINIGMESLMSERIPVNKLGLSGSPDVPAALNPENMSFSQRMAWEERPHV